MNEVRFMADMDYPSMLSAVKKGKKAYRKSCKSGGYIFSDGEILVHTKPHKYNSTPMPGKDYYAYISQVTDFAATDWIILD